MRRSSLFAFILTLVAACANPGAPDGPPANGAPVIASVTVTPATGIQELTRYTFSATATDPENDPLTYQWTINGQSYTGASVSSLAFTTPGDLTAMVTASDGRGGTVSGQQPFVVGSLAGTWSGSSDLLGAFTLQLTQRQFSVAGTMTTDFGPGSSYGINNTISAAGEFTIAFELPGVTAFRFWGQLSADGRQATGTIESNDFFSHPFSWSKIS